MVRVVKSKTSSMQNSQVQPCFRTDKQPSLLSQRQVGTSAELRSAKGANPDSGDALSMFSRTISGAQPGKEEQLYSNC